MDIRRALAEVFESVFGPDARRLGDDDGPGSIEPWDSVGHLNLILAIEAEFGIEFATAEIPELVSVGMIRDRVVQSQ